MELLDALNWRYATKRMNGEKVSEEKINRITEAIRLSASSMGLQPYSVIMIENEDLRKQLAPAVYNQPQITEGSHVLVFAAYEDVTEPHIDDYLNNIAATRGISVESLAGFRSALMGIVNGRTKEQKYEWSARQAYIALGTGIAAAAVEKVDATPMEGFVPEKVDEFLELKEKGLRSVAILTLGYRDEEKDSMANAKKVRRPVNDFVIEYDLINAN